MRDIARKLGISTSTVSRAFSKPEMVRPELRERILEMARELDYQPNPIARAMVRGQSDLIGLVVPDITNPFFPAIVRGAEDEARKHGLNLIVCNSDGHVAKEKQYLLLRYVTIAVADDQVQTMLARLILRTSHNSREERVGDI